MYQGDKAQKNNLFYEVVHILLAFKVSWLGFEEGQAVGCLFGPVGELEGQFLCPTQYIG